MSAEGIKRNYPWIEAHRAEVWLMTRKDKLLQKIKNNPRSASFSDVRQLLMDVGFAERQPKSGSSHCIYYHTALEQVVVLVKGHDPLPEYQVKDALRALYLLGGESGKD